jgi:DNA-binding beta-propeller fold protein YncE
VHSISYTPLTDPRTDPGTDPDALIREARQRQRKRWLVAAVAVVVTAAAASATAVGLMGGSGSGHRPTPSPSPRESPAPPVPAARLVTVGETRLPRGWSFSVAVGYRAVWVTGHNVTYEVSQATGKIVRTISTPGTDPEACGTGIAAGAGAIWVTHSCRGVYRIDPYTGRVTASLRVPHAGNSIAVAHGLVWVTDYQGTVLRIQPRTDRIVGKPIPVGYGDWTLAPSARTLWVTNYGSPGIRPVSRIDLATGAVRRFGTPGVTDVQAVGAGSLWTSYVRRVNPVTGDAAASINVAGSPARVIFWKGYAWAITEVPRSIRILRIDPATNRVSGKPVTVGKPLSARQYTDPFTATAGPTGLWVLDLGRGLLFHLALRPAHRAVR